MSEFKESFAVYIPDNGSVKSRGVIEEVERDFSRFFGGFTSYQVTGGWVNQAGSLVKEPVVRVFAFADGKEKSKRVNSIRAIARKIKEELDQEAVAVEVNGAMILV